MKSIRELLQRVGALLLALHTTDYELPDDIVEAAEELLPDVERAIDDCDE